MTLRNRIALFISILFTLLFAVVLGTIVIMFSDFRKEEFRQRLEQKAISTMKMLIEVNEIDHQLLKTIDQNTINELYNEKTLIFNSNYELIYSSLDDTKITWTRNDLDYLKENKTFFKRSGENEIYGVFYHMQGKDYYALISANDNVGKRKLAFLIYLTAIAYVLFTILAWALTFFTINRLLRPLNQLHQNISEINEHNLATRIVADNHTRNEIDLIGIEFNQMMNRIENAYQGQKDFTAQASHEFRTPLARISALIENELQVAEGERKASLTAIMQNVIQLRELIHSLLIISKTESDNYYSKEKVRIDEVVYASIEKIHTEYKEFKVNFEITASNDLEDLLSVAANQHLLEIVFINLLRNAYQYSDNGHVNIQLKQYGQRLQAIISNNGETLTADEQKKLFEPFVRGANAKGKAGLGLGLRIIYRILSLYNFEIKYRVTDTGLNEFTILF